MLRAMGEPITLFGEKEVRGAEPLLLLLLTASHCQQSQHKINKTSAAAAAVAGRMWKAWSYH
jgi:hypothetical protein